MIQQYFMTYTIVLSYLNIANLLSIDFDCLSIIFIMNKQEWRTIIELMIYYCLQNWGSETWYLVIVMDNHHFRNEFKYGRISWKNIIVGCSGSFQDDQIFRGLAEIMKQVDTIIFMPYIKRMKVKILILIFLNTNK